MPRENSTDERGVVSLRYAPLVINPRPAFSSCLPLRTVCRMVSHITTEVLWLLSDRVTVRRDRRRQTSHIRQISMYVCHVSLRMTLHDIGAAFGRDRTTVGHACHVVEDRRDDAAFDEFITAVERVTTAVFSATEARIHDR
jgi:hypothetical protein